MFKWLLAFFNAKEKDNMKKYLIVGLGNIGEKYENTRHNIGFKILNHYASSNNFTFKTDKLGDIAYHKIKGRTLVFLKPSTYMNLSGKAIKYWMNKEKIPFDNLLVVTDDLNLSFGAIRLKSKGSDGGHNGLKDTQEKLQTTKYNRFRFGISSDFSEGRQVDYVLGNWSEEENDSLKERLKISNQIIESFVLSGLKNTRNDYNGK